MTVLLVLRIVHVVGGVFWAGTMFFIVLLLEPSVRTVGPDGAKVMGALQARGFMTIMPTVALVTILSGFGLFWKILGAPGTAWVAWPHGAVLTGGGVAALAAFALGVGILRPATLAVGGIMRGVAEMPDGDEKAAALQRVQALRQRSRTAARIIAVLLLIAVTTMAVARYA
jgi:hypothetical protein